MVSPHGTRRVVSPSILIAVTHLLGAGHLTRAAALARAFARDGHAVTLVSGGMPAALRAEPGLRVVQLPPVRIRGTAFGALLDEDGRPIDAARMGARRAGLLAALAETAPAAVVTELYPFGRRVLADEFETLVAAARALRPRPLLLASVRDILAAPSRPERVAQTHARLAGGYDGVLVHADPVLVRLDASWPTEGLTVPLYETGYVDEGEPVTTPPGGGGIVVSGGSSAAGLPLQEAALGAAARLPERAWRILVGRGVSEAGFAALAAGAPANARVERARPDFRALLRAADLSISQAGYNTVVDLMAAGCRALLVPFEAGRETEQRQRAETLARRGLATVLPEAELDAAHLAMEAGRLLAAPPPPPAAIALDGAARSVAIVRGLLAAARPCRGTA